jgi:hypothetical protein
MPDSDATATGGSGPTSGQGESPVGGPKPGVGYWEMMSREEEEEGENRGGKKQRRCERRIADQGSGRGDQLEVVRSW